MFEFIKNKFKRRYIYLIFPILLSECTFNKHEDIKKGNCLNEDSIKNIYSDKNDSSSYVKLVFYCSGDTFERITYEKGVLKKYENWYESNIKAIEKSVVHLKEVPYSGSDSAILYTIEEIGNLKEWNKRRVLVREIKLLPNRKEIKILRDTAGNVLSIDTISY